ncbi:hypothetical protein AX16_004766 [Volvariella volvacea WC 439]|nr:hypothetical protein AX16_004766 [Volvariella volvacea WC 439]
MSQLTAGSCLRLHTASPDDESVFQAAHIVQFLSIKKVNAGSNATDRFRIIMSDGVHFIQAMLATQLNHLVHDNTIQKNTIAVVEKLSCNYVQEKRLIIILALNILQSTAEKIGTPQQIEAGEASVAQRQTSVTPAPETRPAAPLDSRASAAPPVQPKQPPRKPPAQAPGRAVYPIEGLSPYQNNWTIRARVTQKTDIKKWSNPRGEGTLFSVTLMDDSGEIRATAFNQAAEDLYSKFEEGKVYYISKARVNLAKKKFSNVTSDYELALERTTEVEECHEAVNMPTIKYNFVPLSGLKDLQKDAICDVLVIVKEARDATTITSRQSQRDVLKRDLTLVDRSGFQVQMTLWGKQAEQYSVEDGSVIAFKGVKVGDFGGGRSLSMFSSSIMQVNPDLTEGFSLKGWYDAAGTTQTFEEYSGLGGGGGPAVGFNRNEACTITEIKHKEISENKAEFFSTRATILHIKSENLSYPACPTPNCNKKVNEVHDGWRCEKCDKSFSAPEHRYIMSLAVADHTGQVWLQGFNDVGVAIFGMSANDLVDLRERDENAFNVVLHRANFNTFNFSCRAKVDSYNERTRIRYGISKMTPLDYKEEARALRDLLHSSWAR